MAMAHIGTHVKLLYGYKNNNKQIYDLKVREINGNDQRFMLDSKNNIINLLKRITLFDLTYNEISNIIDSLSLGDKNRVLLSLQNSMFGDIMNCILKCPKCTHKLSMSMSIRDILSNSQCKLDNNVLHFEKFTIKLRPISIKAGSTPYENNGDEIIENIVRSCIIDSNPKLSHEKLSSQLIEKISKFLEELDPLAEIEVTTRCEKCHHDFDTFLSPESFFYKEIIVKGDQLEQEVNWLALNYHWSEKDILNLSISKRKKYVHLINDVLTE